MGQVFQPFQKAAAVTRVKLEGRRMKPFAYIGLLLVLAGLLSLIGIFAICIKIGWQPRDGVALGAYAVGVCFVVSLVVLLTMPSKRTRRAIAVVFLFLAVVVFLSRAAIAFQYMGSVANDDFVTLCLGPLPGVIAGCLVIAAMICIILPDRAERK